MSSALAVGVLALASSVTAQEQPHRPDADPPRVIGTSPPAPPLPPGPDGVSNPRWLRQAMAQYPEIALARGVEGRVRLECVAGVDLRLTECRILQETPTGVGFGAAALDGARIYARVEPRMEDGVAVPALVTFNVDFRMGD